MKTQKNNIAVKEESPMIRWISNHPVFVAVLSAAAAALLFTVFLSGINTGIRY